jgi:YD repeat-containing protein
VGYITTNTVDALGRIIETGDIRSNEANQRGYQGLNQFEYNALGQRIVQRDALGNAFTYRYDTLGNIVQSLSPEGVSLSYAYDQQGNRIEENYDGLRLTNRGTFNQNSATFDYFGQLQNTNDLGNNQTQYTYEDGQLRTRTRDFHENGTGVDQTVSYTYHDNGALKSISDSATGAVSNFDYNERGQLVREDRLTINAIGEQTHEITETNYDNNGRIALVEVRDEQGDKILSQVAYTYDLNGNRLSVQVANGYSGNIGQQANRAPELNPDFAGLTYPVAREGSVYEYIVGNVDDIFFDADGDTLNYRLRAIDENATLPVWLDVEERNGQLVVFSNGVIPEGEAANIDAAIVAFEVRDDDVFAEIVPLPFFLPVIENASAQFINATGFDNIGLPTLAEGEVIAPPFTLNLGDHIQDPEGEDLTFNVALAHSVEINGVTRSVNAELRNLIEDFFSVDVSEIGNNHSTE